MSISPPSRVRLSRTVARPGPNDLGQRLLPTQELDAVIWSAYWSYHANVSEGMRVELKRVDDGEKGFEKVFAFLRDRLLAGSLKPAIAWSPSAISQFSSA